MQIDIICVGHKMPTWIEIGFTEYAKRFPKPYRINLIEISLRKRTKNSDLKQLKFQEGEQMLAKVAKNARIIVLDEQGELWNSTQLSQQLNNWQQNYSKLALLIGGPEGLSTHCLEQAQQHWSLSKLTLPHQLVRIVVAEQLYRAWSLLNNHPYHRQ
ncbi:MAG: 23S rRNA (pseudouridine(1915)-N(3))-methyltransferase RlmH [Thiomargarita sp.]|nr:23S rRNA (pseudouridine(1915)-N(3))-methyltransferase RlmH [Thiomargarita sp.]